MISASELDKVIEEQLKFFPERTLEQIASGYAERAARERLTGRHGWANWCDKVAAALYARIRAGQPSETDTTP